MDKWAPIIVAVLGAGGVGTLFALIAIPAEKRLNATRESDKALITDLQTRVAMLEPVVANLQRMLNRTVRERDALAFSLDAACIELRMSATMHELGETASSTLISRWKNTRDSTTVIDELPHDEEESKPNAPQT